MQLGRKMQFIIHVSNLIANSKQEVLLVQEKDPQCYGKYNLPGGHLEFGEAIVSGIKRETREEVGLILEPANLLGVYTGLGNHHFLNFIVYSAMDEAQQVRLQETELIGYDWLAVDGILALPDDKLLHPRR